MNTSESFGNVLRESGTEESWYATSVREREYHEGAFLRMCQAVALSDAYDPALELGLLPVVGGPRTSRPWEEKRCSVRGLRVLRALGCAQRKALANDAGCSADKRVQRQHEDDSQKQAASTKRVPKLSRGVGVCANAGGRARSDAAEVHEWRHGREADARVHKCQWDNTTAGTRTTTKGKGVDLKVI